MRQRTAGDTSPLSELPRVFQRQEKGQSTTRRYAILVITRKISEAFVIGDNITITVVDVKYDRIRLGIEAPKDIPVYRSELLPVAEKPPIAPCVQATIDIPKGVRVTADEFGKLWDVVGSEPAIARQRLAYADQKVPVPFDADLVVLHEPARQHVAERFTDALRAAGYTSVEVKIDKQAYRHELGSVVA